MSNGTLLFRFVIVTFSLLANLVLGKTLQKRPSPITRSRTLQPELGAFTLSGPQETLSFTQAVSTSYPQASQEGGRKEKETLVTEKQVSGKAAIAAPTIADPDIFLNLLPAVPTTFPSSSRSGSTDCGTCIFFYQVC